MKHHRWHRRLGLDRLEERLAPAVGGGFTAAGILGEYFANPDLAGQPAFRRRDVRIDFDWGDARPGGSLDPVYASVAADNYSVRWVGQVVPRFSEPYTFHIAYDDGVRMFLKAPGDAGWTLLVDGWADSGANGTAATVPLVAGQKYDLRLEYRELTDLAEIQLGWSSPSVPREVIEPLAENSYHVDGRGYFMFADAIKTARPAWEGFNGNPAPAMDAQGWPLGDGELVVWEGAPDTYFAGTYRARFTGRADISAWPGGTTGIRFRVPGTNALVDHLYPAQIWNPATNISEFEIVVPSWGASPFVLHTLNTRRLPTDTTPTGITKLEIMRPRTVGGADPYAFGTIFTDVFKEAASPFTSYRWLDVNGDLTESEWSQRVPPTFGRANWPPDDGIVHKNWVYEYQIQFANETGRDLYITVPMRASNDYFTKLARLLRYGSDAAGVPYSSPQANPIHPPLNPNLKAYVELANEVWNFSGPFGQTRQADDDAVAAGLAGAPEWSVVNYDGVLTTSDPGGNSTFDFRRLVRWYALRTVRMSEQFRGVYGSAMGDDARVLLYWQYNNNNDTAIHSLKFLDDYFNNSGGNFVANPRPVNYYIWGAGGASYYGSSNPRGLLATNPIDNPSFDITGGLALGTAHPRPTTVPGWSFTGNAGVYGYQPGGTYTSDGVPLAQIPAPVTGDYAAYVMRGGTISRSIHFDLPGRYAINFTARRRTGWQYDLPIDVMLDGQRVTPQYRAYRGVGEADPAPGFSNIAYSWNINLDVFWVDRLTSATVQIDVPAGGRTVSFSVTGQPAGPGDFDQNQSYMLFDNFSVSSVDRIFEGGIPDTGEALGQVGTGDWTRDRMQIAQYAQAFGLHPASYESGWSLGGDDGASPLQNWAKYRDPRAKLANFAAIDTHAQAGYGMIVYGVYEQWRDWEITSAAAAPLRQSFVERNDQLPAEPTNGLLVPAALTPTLQTLGYAGSGTDWGFTRSADANLSAGEWLTWNVLAPRSGNYTIAAQTVGTNATVSLRVDEGMIASGASGGTTAGVVYLTRGLHTIKLRSVAGSFSVTAVTVTMAGAPVAPTLLSANESDGAVALTWSAVAGASVYRVQYGTAHGVYSQSISAGSNLSATITGLTNNVPYYFVVTAESVAGISLPSNERGVTPLASGQLGNLAIWEFSGLAYNAATAGATSNSSRLTASVLTRGAGLEPGPDWSAQAFGNGFISVPAGGPNNNLWGQTLTEAVARQQYIQFSLTPNPGKAMSIDALEYNAAFQNVTPSHGTGIGYSLDGGATFTTLPATGVPSDGGSTWSASLAGVAALQGRTSPVIFRVYLFGNK
ncbi:MAG: hypothetical protein K1X57_21435, partial [Gemmataceae bacterium]|nr:hypothetical protein [Gemmataceae bacterium]